jgi:uncharacterized membrane protein
VFTSSEVTHTGPLPHPSVLADYDKVQPGLAERIVRMAEMQFQHRVSSEAKTLEANIAIAKRTTWHVVFGQISSLVISLSAIGAGSWVAVHGLPWVGGAFGSTGIAGIIIAVLQARKPAQLPAGQVIHQSEQKKN